MHFATVTLSASFDGYASSYFLESNPSSCLTEVRQHSKDRPSQRELEDERAEGKMRCGRQANYWRYRCRGKRKKSVNGEGKRDRGPFAHPP